MGKEAASASALSSVWKALSSSFSSKGNAEKEANGEGLKPPDEALCTESPGSPTERSLSKPDLPRLHSNRCRHHHFVCPTDLTGGLPLFKHICGGTIF